jgi:hypothetical protein
MEKRLPNPDHVKKTQEARAKVEALAEKYEALKAKELALHDKHEAADAAGASLEELQAIEAEAAHVEREQVLLERALVTAEREAVEARQTAEERTKAAAAAEGKKIIERILAAADELQAAQADYNSLTNELRKLITFKNPNVENAGTFCGPDPGYIFNSLDARFTGWSEPAARFLDGRPARDIKEREPDPRPMVGELILN